MPPSRPVIAFIGLGTMGAPMARRLAGAGFPLRLNDLDPAACERVVASTAASGDVSPPSIWPGPDKAAEDADIVLTMLPNGGVVRAVVDDLGSSLRPGSLLVDMSSSAPSDVQDLARTLAGRDVAMIDAPVSGGVRKAEDGSLSILVGGAEPDLERARPLLEAMGSQIFHCGSHGAGAAMKALNNLLSAAGLAAMVEVLTAGARFGLDPDLMVDVLNASTGRNNSTERKARPFILSGDYSSGFAYDLMVKDVVTALGIVDDGAETMPVCHIAVDRWREGRAHLGEAPDHTEIARAYNVLTGQSLIKPGR